MVAESKVEQPGEKPRAERWGLVTQVILPAVTAARTLVGMTEAVFRTHTFHGQPREFFLWTALDEVFKTAVFLMRFDDFLDVKPERKGADEAEPSGRTIEAILLEEERLRARRLCELLVQLVLFAQKDAPELYEHFLLLGELADASGFNQDLEEFHGARSEWVDETINADLMAIHALEARVNAHDAWYAGRRPARVKDVQGALSSASSRVKRALPQMTAFERLAMGTTYREAFGHPSETIHYRPGADVVDHSRESTVEAEGTKLGQLALCVLRRIHQVLGRPAEPRLEQVSRTIDSNQLAVTLMENLNVRPGILVGDFVSARGHIAQVTDERVSAYGYRSLRVSFLAERPLPSLTAAWFRVREIVLFLSRDRLIAGVRATLGSAAAEVDEGTLTASVLEAWNLREELRTSMQRSQL